MVALGELVSFRSSNGYQLDGILYSNIRNSTTVIHVHGSFGNFYQNQFVRIMADEYLQAEVNFLTFNLTSHDGLAEGYRGADEFLYVGGAVANFGQCLYDIDGAVAFVEPFSRRIILQGHSLGCDRVLHFLLERGARHDFVLLSPCDSYQLQANWIAPETVEHQISRLHLTVASDARDTEIEPVLTTEYGLREGDWTYCIPITRQALLSILEGPPFRLLRMSSPVEFFVASRALVYLGGRDPIRTVSAEAMYRHLEPKVQHLTSVYAETGDHGLSGSERTVAKAVIDWINAYRA